MQERKQGGIASGSRQCQEIGSRDCVDITQLEYTRTYSIRNFAVLLIQ